MHLIGCELKNVVTCRIVEDASFSHLVKLFVFSKSFVVNVYSKEL